MQLFNYFWLLSYTHIKSYSIFEQVTKLNGCNIITVRYCNNWASNRNDWAINLACGVISNGTKIIMSPSWELFGALKLTFRKVRICAKNRFLLYLLLPHSLLVWLRKTVLESYWMRELRRCTVFFCVSKIQNVIRLPNSIKMFCLSERQWHRHFPFADEIYVCVFRVWLFCRMRLNATSSKRRNLAKLLRNFISSTLWCVKIISVC